MANEMNMASIEPTFVKSLNCGDPFSNLFINLNGLFVTLMLWSGPRIDLINALCAKFSDMAVE